MTTTLVTGFEPFGGDPVNASWEAVSRLPERWEGPGRLVTLRLPVTFEGAARELVAALDEHRPDVVVCTGLAAGTAAVRLERVAINVEDARIPDNAGASPVDEPVVPGGPDAYLSTLPLKAALVALGEAGVPAVVSNTAGTYVCNATFYALRHALAGRAGVRAGFVHVPRTREEAPDDDGALPVDDLARALGIVLTTAHAVDHDVRVAAGAVS